jgi:hypothetical protein
MSGALVDEPAACTVRASDAAWVRLPEVPVKLTVAVAALALDAAVNVVLCAVPGGSESVAGLAVTPLGSPVMATATVLLKELTAVARTLIFEPVSPATKVTDVGEVESEKLGPDAAEMVVATVAEWLRVPEVPVKVTVALPDAAEDAAVSVTVCGVPGIKVNVAGLAVTPDGSPATVTLTVPVKPFCAAAFTLTVWPIPPAVSVTVAGVDVSKKSAVRGGTTAE